jgi:chromosome segregation ATPase
VTATPTPTWAERAQALIDEVEPLEAKATSGPWNLWGMQVRAGEGDVDYSSAIADTYYTNDSCRPRTHNATFIATSRTALPAALALLKEAMAENEALRNECQGADARYDAMQDRWSDSVESAEQTIRTINAQNFQLSSQLSALRTERDALKEELEHATAEEGDWLSKASRKMCNTVMNDRDALRQKVRDLTTERDALAVELDRLKEELRHKQKIRNTTREGLEVSAYAARKALAVAEDRVTAIRAALEKYGQHDRRCESLHWDEAVEPPRPCTCGLDAALEEKP